MKAGVRVARAFNLNQHDLQVRFLAPLMSGQEFVYEGNEWSPRKTRVTIYEGRELQTHEIGMGRGWQNVQRSCEDVTTEVLERARQGGIRTQAPESDNALKERIIGRLSAGPLALGDTVRMAGDLMEGRRVSEQMAASEMAVWELLHTDRVRLEADGVEVSQDLWEAVVLSPSSWLDGDRGVRLLAA